jgi:hypothetical protein
MQFRASLPPTPLGEHLVALHHMVDLLSSAVGDQADNFLPVAEHHLREIAIHTSTPDWVRDGIRREVLDDFTAALAQLSATDIRPLPTPKD